MTESTASPEASASLNLPKHVVVRSFGARLLGGQSAEDLATSVFRMQNHLWNKLVEIEQAGRAAYQAALIDSDAGLAELDAKLKLEDVTMAALLDARAKERASERRKKTANASSHATLIKSCSIRIKVLRADMKALKVQAKLAAKPVLEANEKERRAAVAQAAKSFNLWWAHSETVLAKFDVARVRAMKEGAMLRFHRFEGDGTMGVRFSVDGGSLEKIYKGSTSLLSFRDPTPDELGSLLAVKADGGRRKVVRMRAGDKQEDGSIPALEFLVTMHDGHAFPVDMPLKTVSLVRKMHVGRAEWKMVFTFAKPGEAQPLADLPKKAAGIDLGWRLVRSNDGGKALRVACVSFGDSVRYITLDSDWLRRMELADQCRSQLDDLANGFWADLQPKLDKDLIDALDEKNYFRILVGKTKRAKRAYPALLMELCHVHERLEKPLGQEVNTFMQNWCRKATKLAWSAHHGRRKAVDARKHLFRNAAAALVRECGLIGMEEFDLRAVAKLKNEDGSENELAKAARMYRTWAAPSELRLAIVQAAKRESTEMKLVSAAKTTTTCSSCGHEHSGATEDLTFVCDGCGKVWDQDENAGHNIRKAALGSDSVTSSA